MSKPSRIAWRSFIITLSILGGLCAVFGEEVHYCVPGGGWQSTRVQRTDGRLFIDIGPAMAPGGEVLLVVQKPAWMVLDDLTPPMLTGMKVNGVARPASTETLDLGCIGTDVADVIIGIKDTQNPIAADRVRLRFPDAPNAKVTLDTSGCVSPAKSGRIAARISGLTPGQYDGELTLTDLAPMGNSRTWPIKLHVFGVDIDEQNELVTVSTPVGTWKLHVSGVTQHLELPNGQVAWLTANIAGQWVYPWRITSVSMLEDTRECKTVRVVYNTQGIDGKPQEGIGRVEFDMTARTDTPALILTSRSVSIGENAVKNSAFWGWLQAPHYVTPDGRRDWQGKVRDEYISIGHVGWVFLAPLSAGKPGLMWASPDRFSESRFDQMLIYSDEAVCARDECVGVSFAMAPCADAAEAEAIYRDLIDRGLLPKPAEE